jgi:hypothetical protein
MLACKESARSNVIQNFLEINMVKIPPEKTNSH